MIEKNKCIGCSVCVKICPEKCINMYQDEEGFAYPSVDVSKCKNCDLCKNVCPCANPYVKYDIFQTKAYAIQNKSNEIRKYSSSGGVFSCIAEDILRKGGIVYGAAFNNDKYSVTHIGVKNLNELYRLQGSKYLQSDITNVLNEIKNHLEERKLVLFSGTPCQVAAIKKYIEVEYDNLYLIDIVCHGVPSPKVWKKYSLNLEKKMNSKINKVNFRDKVKGWKHFSIKINFENGRELTESYNENLYFRGFLKNIFLRPSCYNCMYKSEERISDITLGDFWGIEAFLPELNDDKGTSFVLVNSKKGKTIMEYIEKNCLVREVEVSDGIKYNSAAIKSVEKPLCRDAFMHKLENTSIDKLLNIYCKVTIKEKIKKNAKFLLRQLK